MAIRNTNFTGSTTNWAQGDKLLSTDLNDTFDAAFSLITTLTTFWLNSDLQTVYDNFDSYSVGAFTSNAKWTVATTNASAAVASSTNAGGSDKEIVLTCSNSTGGSASITSLGLTDDTHKSIKMKCTSTAGGNSDASTSIELQFGGVDYTVASWSGPDNVTMSAYCGILIIALGSNNYDIYVGSSKIASNVNTADPNIRLKLNKTSVSNTDTNVLYIDDVVESSGSV